MKGILSKKDNGFGIVRKYTKTKVGFWKFVFVKKYLILQIKIVNIAKKQEVKTVNNDKNKSIIIKRTYKNGRNLI